MKPFQKTLAAALVSSAVLVVGCASDEEAVAPKETTAKSGPVHPVSGEMLAADQTFTWWALDEHSSFDPQVVEDVTGSHHARNLFEGLFNETASGDLEPGVATRFEANEDKTEYTFFLRDDAKWSNGDPVTAQDFVYAWNRAVDPALASPYSWYMEIMNIKNAAEIIAGEAEVGSLGVTAIDDTTLKVELNNSISYFPQMVVHTTTFPVHQATVEAHGSAWTKPENMVSNGAYKLTQHVVNERVEMERSDTYWNNDETIIDKVVSIVVTDENQALIRYKAGELEMLESLPAGQFPSLQTEFPDEVFAAPRLCSYYYYINQGENGPEALKDVRVRKALSYAIDRDIIVNNVLQGGQFPAYTFTPGATAGFEVPDVPFGQMTQAERDEQAKALLAEAGYADGLDIGILYNTSEAHKSIAVAISQMWKTKLGVTAKLNNLEWKTYLTERSEGNYDVSRAGWCGDYNEASTFLDLMRSDSGYNDGKYANTEVDRLMDEARLLNDPSANYTEVERIVAEEMAVIPLYHYSFNLMLKDDIKGWPYSNVQMNWYARDLYKVAK